MSKQSLEGGLGGRATSDKSRIRIIKDYFFGGSGGEFDTYHNPNLYDRSAHSKLYRRDNLARGTADVAERHVPHGHDSRILDVGAGTGILTLELASRDYAVTALDLFPEPLQHLREKAQRIGRTAQLETVQHDMNAAQLPFDDHQFGAVVSLRANRYIRDLPQWLRETRRVTEPGGTLVLPVFPIDAVPWRRHSDQGIWQPTSVRHITHEVIDAGYVVDRDASMGYTEAADMELGNRDVPFYYRPTFIVAENPVEGPLIEPTYNLDKHRT